VFRGAPPAADVLLSVLAVEMDQDDAVTAMTALQLLELADPAASLLSSCCQRESWTSACCCCSRGHAAAAVAAAVAVALVVRSSCDLSLHGGLFVQQHSPHKALWVLVWGDAPAAVRVLLLAASAMNLYPCCPAC